MAKATLAKRAKVSLPTVNRILLGREKKPTIANVLAIAAALGVTVRLGAMSGVEEVQSVFEFRKAQALAKAKRIVRSVQGTMALEAQAVDAKAIDQMVEQTVCELLSGRPRRLWND